ncbi:hypothetical protein NECAME_09603 [Necator americanus]|uniref:CXC domain-containing protein n=1 Tax=Necator americanus TaxID=51031 RepID=W2TDF8_NECAM|nr:hypothetical protein NECAME_09603 [Necator americanus]ETN79848.1 hypothetical protein NECAME_09603 [Necator americanus]
MTSEISRVNNYCCDCAATQSRCSADNCPCVAARKTCDEHCESTSLGSSSRNKSMGIKGFLIRDTVEPLLMKDWCAIMDWSPNVDHKGDYLHLWNNHNLDKVKRLTVRTKSDGASNERESCDEM